jgi:probable phosphoglycerate mutase
MTTVLLVRHATCDPVGKSIAGRAEGVHLNAEGEQQARRVAARLREVPVAAIYSSPLERARETAEHIARGRDLRVESFDAVAEIDFGEWTGCALEALAALPAWRRFNSFRSGTRIPGGELIAEVQARAVAGLASLRDRHPDGTVAVVSHADVIKAALAYYLGTPLDLMQRLEVAPASVSAVALDAEGVRILALNDRGEPPGA